jgi:hypothetical protein
MWHRATSPSHDIARHRATQKSLFLYIDLYVNIFEMHKNKLLEASYNEIQVSMPSKLQTVKIQKAVNFLYSIS